MGATHPLDARKATVLGLGKSGYAAAKALLARGIEVLVLDAAENERLESASSGLRELGATVSLGDSGPGDTSWPDVVVASPGIRPGSDALLPHVAAGTLVVSEVELAWHLSAGAHAWVAVTGTNGKTTTTSLIAEMLNAGGIPSVAAGNIGFTASDAVSSSARGTVIVCEVSSFQLHFIHEFHPRISVILNVTEDHFDWHSGAENYVAAKARVTENQGEGDLLIVSASDRWCVAIAADSAADIGGFGVRSALEVRDRLARSVNQSASWIGGVEAGWLVVVNGPDTRPIASKTDIRMVGDHNLENVLAASIAALKIGGDLSAVAKVAINFEGLPHRRQFVREVKGVTFINDSKATNPSAALTGARDLDSIVLLAGGEDRGIDLSPLSELIPKLNGVVLMGQTAGELERVFRGLPSHRVSSVEEAVSVAVSMAENGDTVLLSPGCSSQDQYESYEERGDRFAQAVHRL